MTTTCYFATKKRRLTLLTPYHKSAVFAGLPSTVGNLALLLLEADVLVVLLHRPLEEGPAWQTSLGRTVWHCNTSCHPPWLRSRCEALLDWDRQNTFRRPFLSVFCVSLSAEISLNCHRRDSLYDMEVPSSLLTFNFFRSLSRYHDNCN